jgi:hypothetical protein
MLAEPKALEEHALEHQRAECLPPGQQHAHIWLPLGHFGDRERQPMYPGPIVLGQEAPEIWLDLE